MWFTNFTEVQTSKNHRNKNFKSLLEFDSLVMYCLSDFGGLHSNQKTTGCKSISNNNILNNNNIKSSVIPLERAFL